MPILAIGNNPRDRGFTLIEVLSVMVIIGLMGSVILLTLPKDDDGFQDAVNGLLRDVNTAAQSGILTGDAIGFGVTQDGYAVLDFEDSWTPRITRNWPDNMRVEFSMDGEAIKLPKEITPLVMFEPTGQVGAFELILTQNDDQATLRSTAMGQMARVQE